MLLPRLSGALLLVAGAAQAFKNASPFFLLSSDPQDSSAALQSAQVAASQDVEDRLIETLGQCDKKLYYIFRQPSVSASDFKDGGMSKVQKSIKDAEAKDEQVVVQIPEVVGGALNKVESRLREACEKSGKKESDAWPESENEYRIFNMDLPELSGTADERSKIMHDTDDALVDTVVSVLANENPSVLIYTTTPPAPAPHSHEKAYEMDDPFPSSLHTDLKRDLGQHARQDSDRGEDLQAGLPLFERYNFLSQGIFLGLTVVILLFLIGYVGVSAIAGMDVSYAAFSKEMGPSAQNKGKQQ